MQDTFNQLKAKAVGELENVASVKELLELKTKFLGKSGEITALLRGMKDIPAEQRAEFGKVVNQLKEEIASVNQQIEKITNKKCSVKWVNDVYLDDKKVSGILTEASCDFSTGLLDYAIVGIGVNVSEPEGGFDASIKDIACALYEKDAPCGVKNELCAEIVNRFFHYYENMADKCYMEKYRAYSNIIGKSVDVYRGNEVISGVCVDIDECANLVVESDGRIIRFNSGDARVRKI